MKISAFKHHRQVKYPNGRLMPFNAPVSKINFNSQRGFSIFSCALLIPVQFFFSVHHHLAGPRNFINFFSSAVRTANKGTRNTYVHRRCFFQGKVNWKSYPRVPTRSLFFHCIGIWNTARLITKCQFEQHYIVLCHPVKNHLFLVLTIAHFKTRKSQLKIISESPHSISILPLYRDLKQQARLITVFFKM